MRKFKELEDKMSAESRLRVKAKMEGYRDGAYHYSGYGTSSTQFWLRVNALKPASEMLRLYRLGCKLQNLETFIHQELRAAESKNPL